MTIWLNGALVSAKDAQIVASDRGFLLGDGLFETLLVRHGQAMMLNRHMERLRKSASLLRFPVPWSEAQISGAIASVLQANSLPDADRASVRITLTRGPGPRGVLPPTHPAPTLMITCAASPPPPKSLSAIVATVTRRNETSPTSRMKTLGYLDNILARQEAADAGANEAILLNTVGRPTCASVANLFLIQGNTLKTPPISEGCLDGIIRALVLETAPSCGLTPEETPFSMADLMQAETVFLTNSLMGMVPLSQLDHHRFDQADAFSTLQTAMARHL